MKITYSGELVQDGHEGHLSLELDLSLNELHEKMSTSKSQTGFVHSKQTEHQHPESQTPPKSKTKIDQQTQTKFVSNIVTLILTRTVVHTSSAKQDFFQSSTKILEVSPRDTITSSRVAVAQRTEETSASHSIWRATSNHWDASSQYKNHLTWTPITFHTTLLSANSISYVTVWNSVPTASVQKCGCVSDVNFASASSRNVRCENAKKENATTWTINKSGRVMGPTVVAVTDISPKWVNSTLRSTSMAHRIEIVVSSKSEPSSVADISRASQPLLMKNQADSIRMRKYGFGIIGFCFLSVAVSTMFSR